MSTLALQSIADHHLHQRSMYTSAPTPRNIAHKQPATSAGLSSNSNTGVVKPKQTKSRNGCVTCKAKRLKCDETKPTCLQCNKRGVSCGGYKKDFKWRAFGEPSTPATKATRPKAKGLSVEPDSRLAIPSGPSSPALSEISIMSSQPSPLPPLDMQYSPVPDHHAGYYPPYSTYPPHHSSHAPQMFEYDQSFSLSNDNFPSSEDPRYDPYMSEQYSSHPSNPLRLHDLLSPGSNLNREASPPNFMAFPLGGPEIAHGTRGEHMDLGVPVKEEYDNEEEIDEMIRNGGDWQTALPMYFDDPQFQLQTQSYGCRILTNRPVGLCL